MRTSRTPRAFTLVELMLVIVILAILACMSLPLYAAVRGDTKRTAVLSTVQEVQKAICLYKSQVGELPDLVTNWKPLTQPSERSGQKYGPYLYTTPRNLLVAGNESTVIDGAADVYLDQAAFVYDYAGGHGTGRFTAAMFSRP